MIQNEDPRALGVVFEKVNWFANMKLSHAGAYIGMVPIFYGILSNFVMVYKKSKYPVWHQLEGLLPCVLVAVAIKSVSTYSVTFEYQPALMIFLIGPFFSLCCSRLIIATVTKMNFSLFNDFHLSAGFFMIILAFPLNRLMDLNIDENLIYYGLMVINYSLYFWYIVNVIGQITTYLDIHCLSIKKQKIKPQ